MLIKSDRKQTNNNKACKLFLLYYNTQDNSQGILENNLDCTSYIASISFA